MKNQNTVFGAIFFFFLLLFIYTKFIGPFPFSVSSVTTTKTNLFQVTGTGEATAIPNTATLSFGVTKTANTVSDAQNQTNTAITAILNSIKTLGIDTKDIKTVNYSVYPQYNYVSGTQTPSGYSVTQNIAVKLTPIDKAGKAVDLATAAGANVLGNITFILDTQTQQKIEQQAREDAVKQAQIKAESLAKAAGIKLGRIIDIQETPNEQPILMPMLAAGVAKTDTTSQPTQLPSGTSTVSISVTLSYETY